MCGLTQQYCSGLCGTCLGRSGLLYTAYALYIRVVPMRRDHCTKYLCNDRGNLASSAACISLGSPCCFQHLWHLCNHSSAVELCSSSVAHAYVAQMTLDCGAQKLISLKHHSLAEVGSHVSNVSMHCTKHCLYDVKKLMAGAPLHSDQKECFWRQVCRHEGHS